VKRLLPYLSLIVLIALVLSACTTATPAAPAPAAPTQVQQEAAATSAPTEVPAPTEAPAAPAAPTAEAATAAPTVQASGEITATAAISVPRTLRLPDLQGRKVRAVTENAYTPLNFVDPVTGKAMGWEYDAVNEICRRLNCEVEWNTIAWDAMIPAVKDSQFDVGMDGITINDERKQQVAFSDPYMTSQQFMLVRADESRFTDAKSFAANPDLLIGAQPGTTNFYVAVNDVLDGNQQNPRIKLFETFGATVQALLAGDVDAVLMDAASSRGYIGANPNKLKTIGGPLGTEDFGFIFTPNSDLVQPFNAALKTMKDDGLIAALDNRWFFLYDPTAK
jgi:polar amino acid transport system substrate-binding protein